MKKKLISLIVATLTIASLAACGSTDTASDKSPVASESAAKDEADAADTDANAKEAADKTVEANLDDMAFSPENFEIVMAFVNEYEDDFGTLKESILNMMGTEIPAELYENKFNPGSHGVNRLLISGSSVECPVELKEVYELVAGNGSTISYDAAQEIPYTLSCTYEELCEMLGCEGTPVGFHVGNSGNYIYYAWESDEPTSSGLRRFWLTGADGKTNMVDSFFESEYVRIGE